MHNLFIKYLDNKCSPEEVVQLLEYFRIPENESALRKLINLSLQNVADHSGSVKISLPDKVYTALKQQLNKNRIIWFSFSKNRLNALASCLLLEMVL